MKCEICGKEILRDSQCINYKYYHNDCIENLQQENKQLKDNWDKLRKFIGECLEAINAIQKTIGNAIENYTPRILTYKQILDKMQELEGSDSNDKGNI